MTSPAETVVADTNLVSYIARRSPIADYYLPHLAGRQVVISFQTVQELWFGAYNNRWGMRRTDELAELIQQYEVVWPDPDILQISAHIRSVLQAAGRRLEVADSWIAATALFLECPLVSHDGDFKNIPGLQLIREHPP